MAVVLPEIRRGDLVVPAHEDELRGGGYYRFDPQRVTRDNRVHLMNRAWDLHKQLHLDSDRTLAELINHFTPGAEVVFVDSVAPKPKDVGYLVQREREAIVGGEVIRALMIGAKVISPDHQKHGLGTELALDGILRHRPDAITGRTPNPYAILTYERTGYVREIYPTDRLLPPQVSIYLAVLLDKAAAAETDLINRTGLCRGVYPVGESRLFVLNRDNPDAVRIYNAMTNPPVGANLHAGDGVRYWARVDARKISYRPPTVDITDPSPVRRIPVAASGR